ncbi:MAG: type II toxin-antitoxin system ParD family antitoxin [Dermabacter sp.]|nr:type II toxin-antitoxin system ParD family antitoxin [Dermabacter sp.]
MSITLPHAMAHALRERVDSGDYASESEVIRDGLRALFARDEAVEAVEAWLREEVATAYDALVADPNDVASVDDVRVHLAARHAARQ